LDKKHLTKKILEEVTLENFLHDNSCRLKKVDSLQGISYAKIDITDAIYGKYIICTDDKKKFSFSSIDELISAGWEVD